MSERRRYTLINDRDRFFAQRAVKEAPAGYVVEIKPAGRSLLQNDRLHAMLSDISKQVEWYGVKMGVEDWKRIFCAALDGVKVVPGIDPGTFVPVGLRTRDMTKAELGDLMTFIESWGAERNVVFRDHADQRERQMA